MKNRITITHSRFAVGLAIALLLLSVTAVSIKDFSGRVAASERAEISAQAADCFTICFRSPEYYLLNPRAHIRVPVLIAGENYDNPTLDPASIYFALRGPGIFSASNPTKLLNQQFVAAQLSLANAGGDGSPTAFNALNGLLSCYGLPAAPVTLSNGVTLDSNSTLGDLFAETRDAIQDKRIVDYIPLKGILEKLYSPTVLSYCP